MHDELILPCIPGGPRLLAKTETSSSVYTPHYCVMQELWTMNKLPMFIYLPTVFNSAVST